MQISSIISSVFWWWCVNITATFALSRSKEVVSGKGAGFEPSCEELKAMWRFSKRQSRAAEITNELPVYKDAFSENVWDPYYATSRTMGGMRIGHYNRSPRPIYGRLVHNPPSLLRIQNVEERNKAFEELTRMYNGAGLPLEPRRRVTAFRLPGGGFLPHPGLPMQTGSFQHLKELIRTERARELQQQREEEESAARQAVMKQMEAFNQQRNYPDYNYEYDDDYYKQKEGQNTGRGGKGRSREGLIAFPNLLAPTARGEDTRYLQDYVYTRKKSSSNPHLLDTSSYDNRWK